MKTTEYTKTFLDEFLENQYEERAESEHELVRNMEKTVSEPSENLEESNGDMWIKMGNPPEK